MAGYNLFFVDLGGAVLRWLVIGGDSDQEALDMAASHDDGHDIEIWEGERLVAIFRSGKARP